jgi:hypothetical protein
MKTCRNHLCLLCICGMLPVLFCNLFSGNPASESSADLTVKFENDTGSTFPIVSIELMAMGPAGTEAPEPSGIWEENLLADSDSIAPGDYRMFTLKIPNLHYCKYRLGVLDENGTRVVIDDQNTGTLISFTGVITHWGSDERTVSATVVRDTDCDCIVQSGYSDFAGIE